MNVDPANSETAKADLESVDRDNVELDILINLFFEDKSKLGTFREISRDEIPDPGKRLLAHDHHMTVTIEDHYNCPVDVQVLETRDDENLYSRKILLKRQSDGGVVQYGIVRLNMDVLDDDVQAEIRRKETPLGRVLINHNVMREVKLLKLYEIQCGEALLESFSLDSSGNQPTICYGRTALIYCDGSPAIELLEIVS